MADRDNPFEPLQSLDPSPIEETPIHLEDNSPDSYFPPSNPSTRPPPSQSPPPSSHLGLSGNSHTPIYYLLRLQKFSSLTFLAFATAHITNTSLIPLLTRSVPASEPYLLLTRPYYQSWPIAEPLLIIAPLVIHVASGVGLRLYRRNLAAERYGAETRAEKRKYRSALWPVLSSQSKLGYALVPIIAAHTLVNRVIPARTEGGSSNINLSYVSHGFARAPIISHIGYTALVGTAVWHFTWGIAKWSGVLPENISAQNGNGDARRARRRWLIHGISALVTAVWMAGGLGVVGRAGEAGGWIGRGYDDMLRGVPVVGNWMVGGVRS
nr:hypothetical protein B0A51_01771 [Rachicladosporium sp. CCFEE 5018]